jgi:alkanesulfonate monooxygenase SsuD/methylene tetrahydromethanopterin reductase-like flavin-dependent oxidoreductase (luciferase family)
MAAQSVGATRRAARLTDGVFFGPQIGWDSVEKLARVFREERAATRASTAGSVGASRALIVGPSREAAATAARAYLEKTFAMYRTWQMQESTMMELQLSFDVPLESWTVCGAPRDCVETLARASAMGLDRVGFTIYSLPREPKARIDYLQMIAEEILRPAGASTV